MSENKTPKKKRTSKQIVALGGVILLVALYILPLLVAIFAPQPAGHLFQACLMATVFVPILIWIYVWMYGKLTGKHTMADPEYLQNSDTEE